MNRFVEMLWYVFVAGMLCVCLAVLGVPAIPLYFIFLILVGLLLVSTRRNSTPGGPK